MPGLLAAKDPTYDESGQRIPHRSTKKRNPVAPIATPNGSVALDLVRGRTDPVFWAQRFLGINLHRSQRRWIRACALRADDGWRPAFLTTAVSAGNRAGKTLGMAVTIAHQCFYKLGIRPPRPGDAADSERWSRAPFQWYHVAIQQETAELVYNELVLILQGTHPAQYDKETGESRGCPLIEELGPVITWDKKFRGEYCWIRFHEQIGGAEIHFRTTLDKAKALLGKDMNGISFDEAAFELYLVTIRNEVLHFRRLSTGGPLYFISTPTEGHNDFYDLWEEGDPENPNRDQKTLSVRMSTRDNIGFGITQEDFDDLVRTYPEYLIPQNVDGEFIEATDAYFSAPAVEAVFKPSPVTCQPCKGKGEILRPLPNSKLRTLVKCPSCKGEGAFDVTAIDEEPPQAGHRYVQGGDPALRADGFWAITLDFNHSYMRGVRAVRKRGRQQLPAVVNMVREGHLLYQQDGASCTTVIDSTGLGGKMFRQEFSIISPLREFDFAGTKAKKLELLSDLKTVIDKGMLKLPATGVWPEVRRQLLGYRLDDGKIEQDAVMALAIAVRHAVRNPNAAPDEPEPFHYFGD